MTLKVHLVSSETPLESYKDVKVACGQVLSDGECVAMLDINFRDSMRGQIKLLGTCRKCIEAGQDKVKRYNYGLVSAQEMKLQAGTYLSEGDIA